MKTKTAYVVRYSMNSNGTDRKTAGKNLRTYRAAQRGVRTLKSRGIKDCWISSLTVNATDILRG